MSKSDTETPAAEVPVINVAKIITFDSLSELSKLEGHIGYEVGNLGRFHIRIWKNSGGGKFNSDWFSFGAVEKALAGVPADGTFKAATLAPIAEGKSANTASFVGAALLAEGLIVRSEKVARTYERGNADMWRKSLQVLAEAGTNLPVAPIVKPVGHSITGAGAGAGAGAGTVQAKSSKKQKPATALPHPVS